MKNRKLLTKNRGYSLVEIMVVVGIMLLFFAVVTPSYITSREKSRDAQRVSDLAKIKLALESFYMYNGYYPPSGCGWDCNGYSQSYSTNWLTLQNYLSPYLQGELPRDPKNSSCSPWTTSSECYSYAYGNVGKENYPAQYDLTARLEYKQNPLRCELKNYKFYFNSTIAWCGSYSKYVYEASS